MALRPDRPDGRASPRTHVVVAFYLAAAIVAFLWHGASQGSNNIWSAPDSGSPLWLALGPGLGLAFGLASVAGMRWLEPRIRTLVALRDEFASIFGQMRSAEIFWLAAASAVGEELLFRGAMMDAWGLLPSSLIFALLHLPPRRELWPWTASAALLGLALGGLTLLTGNLGAAVVAHFAINALNFRYISQSGRPQKR